MIHHWSLQKEKEFLKCHPVHDDLKLSYHSQKMQNNIQTILHKRWHLGRIRAHNTRVTCNPQVKLLEASGFDSNDFDKPVAQVACVARTWELDLIPEAAPSWESASVSSSVVTSVLVAESDKVMWLWACNLVWHCDCEAACRTAPWVALAVAPAAQCLIWFFGRGQRPTFWRSWTLRDLTSTCMVKTFRF